MTVLPRPHANPWRIAGWSLAAALLAAPLVAMRFSDEVDWNAFDFALAAALLGGVGLAAELAVRMTRNPAYRAAAALALAAGFLLVWLTGAVGIIGPENDPANLMFAGVLGVALVGALLARFRPAGMALAMTLAAVAQSLAGLAALVFGLGRSDPTWPLDALGLTAVFVALWLASAWLFRKSA